MTASKRYNQAVAEQIAVISEYTQLEKEYPDLIGLEPIEMKIVKQEQSNKEIGLILEQIKSKELKLGVSRYLRYLAQETPSSTWFTNIYIDLAKKNINLKGYTLVKEEIPKLINKIENTSLAGNKISIFNLNHANGGNKVKFHIGTLKLEELEDLITITKQQEIQQQQKMTKQQEINKAEKKDSKTKKLTEMKTYYFNEEERRGRQRLFRGFFNR